MESSTLIDAWLKLRRIFERRPTLVSEKEEGREKRGPGLKRDLYGCGFDQWQFTSSNRAGSGCCRQSSPSTSNPNAVMWRIDVGEQRD
jgi:hypothetical protein